MYSSFLFWCAAGRKFRQNADFSIFSLETILYLRLSARNYSENFAVPLSKSCSDSAGAAAVFRLFFPRDCKNLHSLSFAGARKKAGLKRETGFGQAVY
ncbi:MAG: hypothetical protein ACI4PV_03030 [Butyricicoccus sp.]